MTHPQLVPCGESPLYVYRLGGGGGRGSWEGGQVKHAASPGYICDRYS